MSNLTAGSSAPAGTYSCASCNSSITLASGSQLPACTSCGGTSWLPSGGRPDKDPKPVGSI
jgi:hypothetical protein